VEGPTHRPSSPATLIVSVQRALRLMEAVAGHPGGAVAKALARDTGFPLGTTYHLLRTLTFEGYLRRQPDGAYMLSEGISSLFDGGRSQGVVCQVRGQLGALRDEVRAAAYFGLYEDGEIVLKEVVDGPRTPRVVPWVHFDDAAHATALGKSVLCSIEPEARSDYLSQHQLRALTPRTIIDERRLETELDLSSTEGVAVDREEYSIGTICVATPVQAGPQVGAVAVSFPARRAGEVPAIGSAVRKVGTRLSTTLSLTI
jgi:IclR family acetate operon transcriptional repressor